MRRTLGLTLLVATATVLASCRQEPEPPPTETETVADVLTAEGFTTLALALTTAGLSETLAGEGPFTLLAPTNEAFEALPEGALDALLDDPATLTEVLEYHLLNPLDGKAITEADFIDAGPSMWLTTQISRLAVTLEGEGDAAEVVINGVATVTEPDLEADNGIVHGIDAVLMIPETEFSATLSGANEVPPVESDATGTLTATLDGSTLTISGTYEGLTVTEPGAHIHGPADVENNADVLFPLTFDNEAGTLSATIELGAEENAAFSPAAFGYLQNGLLYANLHTEENPSGEIRGQLLPAEDAPAPAPDFTAVLSGAEEVPPVETEANGTATATLDEAGTTLTLEGTYTGLSSPLQEVMGSAAHIHEAPSGENGPVVVPLTITSDETDPTSGTFSGTAPIGEGEGQLALETLAANSYYINIHTEGSGVTSSSEPSTTSARASTTSRGIKRGSGTAMTRIPAALPASMPWPESSRQTHASGGTPRRRAVSRYTSGCGLLRPTSSAETTASKRPANSGAATTMSIRFRTDPEAKPTG